MWSASMAGSACRSPSAACRAAGQGLAAGGPAAGSGSDACSPGGGRVVVQAVSSSTRRNFVPPRADREVMTRSTAASGFGRRRA